jgi:L-lysine exporter family protein LysE/ArgO
MVSVFIEGLLLQASLIFALGAQNLFILESGLKRNYHLTASFVCYLCDFTIIMLGVMGAGTLFNSFPEIKIIFGIAGIYFLFTYGYGKLRTREEEFVVNELSKSRSLKTCILAALSFSVLNPHAFLDGIVLIGGYSGKYSEMNQRIALGFGASTYSLFWFLALSTASSKMMPFLSSPRRMRSVMCVAGVFLIFLSAKLSVDVYGWVREEFNHQQMLRPTLALNNHPADVVHYFQSIIY